MKYIFVFFHLSLWTALGLICTALVSACAGFGLWKQAGQIEPNPAVSSAELRQDGVYEGSGCGYRGTIRVQVRMEGGEFVEISIIESDEDSTVGGAAIEELLETALIYNTTDIDAISGATESSRGFLEALENALRKYWLASN